MKKKKNQCGTKSKEKPKKCFLQFQFQVTNKNVGKNSAEIFQDVEINFWFSNIEVVGLILENFFFSHENNK